MTVTCATCTALVHTLQDAHASLGSQPARKLSGKMRQPGELAQHTGKLQRQLDSPAICLPRRVLMSGGSSSTVTNLRALLFAP